MRIAIAQTNPILADLKTNSEKIISFVQRAVDKKAELVIFPEAALFGYHPFDLLERKNLVEAQIKELDKLKNKIPKNVHVLVGFIEPNKAKKGKPYYNSAALITHKKIVKIFRKELLPTGDVFDEARFIEKGSLKDNFFKIGKRKFFLTICEDIWAWPDATGHSSYAENPLQKIKSKVDLVINMSASPFFTEKMKLRNHVTSQTAKHFKSPIVYVNLVGAQDEIIFDGASFVLDEKGNKKFSCESFAEDLNLFDLDTLESWHSRKPTSQIEQLRSALILGIQDFCLKTGLNKVHFGLSGGIDSAVLACLAVDALGPQNVKTMALPGPFNLDESYTAAQNLAKNLAIDFGKFEIEGVYNQFSEGLKKSFGIDHFSVVHENLQSRIRGAVMMAYSNHTGSLLLTTGNKSEYATGYATLYGDMCGGLAPLGDLTKKQVYELAKYYNKEREVIPNFIIDRPPSAELKPNQKDQDSLPAYDDLDKAVENLVEKNQPAKSKTEKWLIDILMKTEFKRWQAAPILKVSSHSFGRGRRYPLAHKNRI